MTLNHQKTGLKTLLWLLLCSITFLGTTLKADESQAVKIRFSTEVVPLLTRLGCNGGGCHGKSTGQNGFRLSLLGFEPDVDYQSLVNEARGRRIFPAAPEKSLILLKATARMPHGGGRLLDESSDDYRILKGWIEQGAIGPQANDPQLVRIELTPQGQILKSKSGHNTIFNLNFTTNSFDSNSHPTYTRNLYCSIGRIQTSQCHTT